MHDLPARTQIHVTHKYK